MAPKKNNGSGNGARKPAPGEKKSNIKPSERKKPQEKPKKPPKQPKRTPKKPEPEVEIPVATPLEAFNSEVLGIALIALGVLFAIYLYRGAMPASGIGKYVYWVLFNAVGMVAYALPPFCAIMGVLVIAGRKRTPAAGRILVFVFLIIFIAALIHLMGGITYKAPTAGANTARTVERSWNAFKDYIVECSERSLGTSPEKYASRGGGVIGGFICLLFFVLGGQSLCAVAVAAGLIICLLLITRISLKTFPDILRGSISRLFERIDPEDDGTEDTEFIPLGGKKRNLYMESLDEEEEEEEETGEESEEEEEIDVGHLSEVNEVNELRRMRPRKKKHKRVTEDTGSDEYDGFFNNEPIDDVLPMEPELRVTDMKEEARKRAEKKNKKDEPAIFGANEGSFLSAPAEPGEEKIPEALLFGDEPDPVRPQAGTRPAPAKKPEPPVLTKETEPAGDTEPAPELFGDGEPDAPVTKAGHGTGSAETPEGQPEGPESLEDMKKALEARPYTDAEKAEENAPKPAPKFRPVDEVTGEPLPEAQEAPEVYEPFPIDCLNDPPKNYSKATDDPEQVGKLLVETLKNFGIEAKLLEWSVGPVVTRYELQPAPGVRVNKITALANDIALALAATRVRIEAPIPNKAAVGIEVPNKKAASVFLKEIISSDTFINMKSPVAMAMGKDIGGKIVVADLSKMPHMLIAGSTGSGKSVCINNLILSMVYKSAPTDLRLILVDPKQVELSVYGHLPHLLIPVVTDPKKASSALRWAVNEMTLRYTKFSQRGARDLNRYNSLQTEEKEKLPRIVVIIDELADLMMVSPDEVEDSICRIAQLGRAAGIHLIVATQRPSSDVITGLIKANIPSRAAFAVSSAIDSRIILDAVGAEKLLGKGDCLFHPNGADKPTRLQAAFVSDEEVEQVMEHYKSAKAPVYEQGVLETINSPAGGGAKGGVFGEGKQEDDLLGEAVRIVLDSGQASISMIQRKLRVGYARAARLVDMMEEKGYVSGFDGSKPRKVLIKRAEFEQIFGDGSYVPPDEEPGANAEDGYVPEEYRE